MEDNGRKQQKQNSITMAGGAMSGQRVFVLSQGASFDTLISEFEAYGVPVTLCEPAGNLIDLSASDLAGASLILYSPDSLSAECRKAVLEAGIAALPLSDDGSGVADERFLAYVKNGTSANLTSAVRYLLRSFMNRKDVRKEEEPVSVPPFAIISGESLFCSFDEYLAHRERQRKSAALLREDNVSVGILVHRSTYLTDGLSSFLALEKKLERLGAGVVLAYTDASEENDFEKVFSQLFCRGGDSEAPAIRIFLNACLFAFRALGRLTAQEVAAMTYERFNMPVLSPVNAWFCDRASWESDINPLARDMPSSLILPEMTGAIEEMMMSVREDSGEGRGRALLPDRINLLARRIKAYLSLSKKPNAEKKTVILLHNAVCQGVEASIGKAYGLDPFESAAKVLLALSKNGYDIGDAPVTGAEIKEVLLSRRAFSDFRWTSVSDIDKAGGAVYKMSLNEYLSYLNELPSSVRASMIDVWGEAPGEAMVLDGKLLITGAAYGNILLAVQPKRGCWGPKCTGEVCKILHDPICPPPHQYLATYRYFRRNFGADAMIEIGTDGSAEYLPGKSSGLTENCWPSIVIDDMPVFYAWHAGVVSEGLLVKRRLGAVTVTYLPSGTRPDPAHSALLEVVRQYLNAVEQRNGQETALKEKILRAADTHDVVMRIFERERSFDKAVMELSSQLNEIVACPAFSKKHVLGEVNVEEKEAYRFSMSVDPVARNELKNLLAGLDGEFIPPTPGGLPDGEDTGFLPTGRNLYGMDISKIPTPAAWERGKILAGDLIDAYVADMGSFPRQIAMNMISLDITRTSGEQLSSFLHLLGIEPVWDASGRVSGLEVLPADVLGRPRIDVTVRITGVMRDMWPFAIEIMDKAVKLASVLDEPEEDNFLAYHVKQSGGNDTRIFGDPPGAYGSGVNLALLASAWTEDGDLARVFIENSAFAYGGGRNGKKETAGFIDIAGRVSLTADTVPVSDHSGHASSFSSEVHGGWRLAAEAVSRSQEAANGPVLAYQQSNEPGQSIVTNSLSAYLNRMLERTLLSDFFLDAMMREGYDGAGDIMEFVQNVFSSQCLLSAFDDAVLDNLSRKVLLDPRVAEWFSRENPWAMEESVRRMMELVSREKYIPASDVLEGLKQRMLTAEGEMEEMSGSEDIQAGSVDIITWREVEAMKKKYDELSIYFTKKEPIS